MKRTFVQTKLLIFTGAGISAESGISTFRDANGLWENHDIDQVCNYVTWKKNFELVHRFYNERRSQLNSVAPNHAHEMIADWQRRYEAVVITQNVDDLLERAGCTDVIHVHGFLPEMKCEACGHVWNIGYTAFEAGTSTCPIERCKSKRGVKPNVVFFHEGAPEYSTMYRAFSSVPDKGIIVALGTSGQVISIGSLCDTSRGYKILNNLEPSQEPKPYEHLPGQFASMESAFDWCIFKPATRGVDDIDAIIRQRFGQ